MKDFLSPPVLEESKPRNWLEAFRWEHGSFKFIWSNLLWDIKLAPKKLYRTWKLAKLYYFTEDCDWSTIATLMEYQIRRTRDHIKEHNIVADAPKVVRQMTIAANLLYRLNEDGYYHIAARRWPNYQHDDFETRLWAKMCDDLTKHDEEMLASILKKHLRSWWD